MNPQAQIKRYGKAQKGMTLIEILIVVAILGILANIAAPIIRRAILRAQAAKIIADFTAVRKAAIEHYRDHGAFPRDRYPGASPRELAPYLKDAVQWRAGSGEWQYDWDMWIRNDGRPQHPRSAVLVGFSVTTRNRDLIRQIEKQYDGPFWWTLNNNYTFVIEPVPGRNPPRQPQWLR